MTDKVKKQPIREEDSVKSELVRRFKTNPGIFIGTVVILIIVIVAFVFVPAFGPGSGGLNADLTFGYYEKVPITYRPGNYFAQMHDYYTRQMQGSFSADDAFLVNYQIWQSSYQAAVVHTAVLQEMKKAGYEPPKDLVDREVALRYLTSYRRMNDAERMALWREVKESMAAEKYENDQYEILKPAGEDAFVTAMASPQRRFEGTAFNLKDYPEEEVTAFAIQNSALFLSIHFSQITITSGEREARQILATVRDGTSSFEDAARNQSQDTYADRGGDTGIQMAYELAATVREEADRNRILALRKGEVSDLINTGETWVFFRAEEDPIPVDTNDPSQVEKIRSYILLFERGRMDDYFIHKAEELRARAASEGFTAALEEAELEKFSFGPLAVNYGNQDFLPRLAVIEGFSQAALSNFAVNDSFWLTAFSTPLGQISEPLVLGDQVLLFLPLEETEIGEEDAENLKLSFQYALLNAAGNIQTFFTQSPKLKDQFWDTYRRYLMN
ncbi:MAG: peptidylprolyl isomerase [Treponema sp.]|jgi:hypothetical protein|nr:peptidylprolyl isomerase [Treponema sp.]